MVFRLVTRVVLTAGAGLAGSVLASLLLTGPAQADTGEAAETPESGLAGDLVTAVTTPAAELVAEAAEAAEPVTEVAEVAEPVTEVAEASEPVAEVAEPVTEVAEPVTEATTTGVAGTAIETVDEIESGTGQPVVELVAPVRLPAVAPLAEPVGRTVDDLVQDTGELVISTVDHVRSTTDPVLAVVPSVTGGVPDPPVPDLPVVDLLDPALVDPDVLDPDVLDPDLPVASPVGPALLAPDGPPAPVPPIPLPIADPLAPLLGGPGQAPLSGVAATPAEADRGRVPDGDRDQSRAPEPVAWAGVGFADPPQPASGMSSPAIAGGPDPPPVDLPAFPFGQLAMPGSHQHAGNPTDAGQPLSAATAAMSQPTADSVCIGLPDDLTVVGLVMAIAVPPG